MQECKRSAHGMMIVAKSLKTIAKGMQNKKFNVANPNKKMEIMR